MYVLNAVGEEEYIYICTYMYMCMHMNICAVGEEAHYLRTKTLAFAGCVTQPIAFGL